LVRTFFLKLTNNNYFTFRWDLGTNTFYKFK